MENLAAEEALKQSWKMTKGHFWYVAGCYLFLGALGWAVAWASGETGAQFEIGNGKKMIELGLKVLESSWIILAWCMYLRIKDADAEIDMEPTQSPSARPSAS